MPYMTQWVIDNRIIKTRIEPNISPDIKAAQDDLINELLEQSEKQISHLILDCRDLHFPTFRSWRWVQNRRLGWVVIYGIQNPIMKGAIHLGFQVLGVRSQFVSDQDEALSFLQEVDITLPKAHIA